MFRGHDLKEARALTLSTRALFGAKFFFPLFPQKHVDIFWGRKFLNMPIKHAYHSAFTANNWTEKSGDGYALKDAGGRGCWSAGITIWQPHDGGKRDLSGMPEMHFMHSG